MKKQSIFPSLPNNLSVPQLRKEIRRRLKISEQLGLIKKPRKWSAGQRLDQVGNARNHHWKVKEDAACMEACRYLVQTTLRSFMGIAPKSIARSVRLERSTLNTWRTWRFSLAWLNPREGAEYDAAAIFDTCLQTLSLPYESQIMQPTSFKHFCLGFSCNTWFFQNTSKNSVVSILKLFWTLIRNAPPCVLVQKEGWGIFLTISADIVNLAWNLQKLINSVN